MTVPLNLSLVRPRRCQAWIDSPNSIPASQTKGSGSGSFVFRTANARVRGSGRDRTAAIFPTTAVSCEGFPPELLRYRRQAFSTASVELELAAFSPLGTEPGFNDSPPVSDTNRGLTLLKPLPEFRRLPPLVTRDPSPAGVASSLIAFQKRMV